MDSIKAHATSCELVSFLQTKEKTDRKSSYEVLRGVVTRKCSGISGNRHRILHSSVLFVDERLMK